MQFINDDFILSTESARILYHGYSADLPIIDYHCHLPPGKIAGMNTVIGGNVWLTRSVPPPQQSLQPPTRPPDQIES